MYFLLYCSSTIHYVGVNGIDYRYMDHYHKVRISFFHSDYNPLLDDKLNIDYDIGLIKTETSMLIDTTTKACLNTISLSELKGKQLYVYGWGFSEQRGKKTLTRLKLTYDDNVDGCKDLPSVKMGHNLCFLSRNEYSKISFGDSGSPVMWHSGRNGCTDTIVSTVTSFFNEDDDLTKKTLYQVGINLSHYKNWIESVTRTIDAHS